MTGFLETYLGKLLATAAMSMLPVVELRGGIPYGTALGLDPWSAFWAAVVGNMLPVPFILLLIRRVFAWLHRGRLGPTICRLEQRAHLKGRVVQKYRLPGLVILVAIPLPGTGAWTGALAAAFLDMPLRKALPSIFAGVLVAGVAISILTFGVASLF